MNTCMQFDTVCIETKMSATNVSSDENDTILRRKYICVFLSVNDSFDRQNSCQSFPDFF